MSPIWRRLKEISQLAESQIGFSIHRGNCFFFHDCWNLRNKLNDSFEWSLYPPMSFKAVHSLPSQDALRQDILNRLSAEDLSLFAQIILDNGDDQIFWKGTPSGQFQLTSAWDYIRQKKPQNSLRAYIWSSRIPLKISVFLWRLQHSWIPTQDILKKLRISLASKCLFCESEETLNHIFVNCKLASEIWSFFEYTLCIFPRNCLTIQSKFHSWWNLNLTNADHEVYNLLACLIVWEIWKAINTCFHDGKQVPVPKICDRIIFSIRNISEAKPFSGISGALQRTLQLRMKEIRPKLCRIISWCPPDNNRWKLNVDGSSCSGHSGGGGLIRNNQGIPLFGFSNYYGNLSSISAECRALHDGVNLCLLHGFSSVDVEMDSLLLCQMLKGTTATAWKIENDIRQIKLSTASLDFTFSHIFREANAAADLLANQASSFHQSYSFDRKSLPAIIKGTVALDAIKFPYTRLS